MDKVEICYTELYELLGQLLALNDATSENEIKRKANKQFIKRVCYDWLDEQYALKRGEFVKAPRGIGDIQPFDPSSDSGMVKG